MVFFKRERDGGYPNDPTSRLGHVTLRPAAFYFYSFFELPRIVAALLIIAVLGIF